MENVVVVREAQKSDNQFILEMSPYLAEVAQLEWHSDDAVKKMQDNYILEMLAETSTPNTTLIAELNNVPLGFVHIRTRNDDISGEISGTIPLLAVSPTSQGLGIGKLLMASAEEWVMSLGCRLIHLEVFANNSRANNFYQNIGFKPETLHMIKKL